MGGSNRRDGRVSGGSTSYGRQQQRYPSHTARKTTGLPGTNRITNIDATQLSNNHPDVPSSPEEIAYHFKGRLPMTNRLTGLVLDEQQFLNKEELQEKVEQGLANLKPREIQFADGILTGKTAARAYLDAGYETKKGGNDKTRMDAARLDANTLRKRDDVASYISAVIRLNHLLAMEEAGFSHVEWLQKQRDLLEMALGQKQIRKVFIKDGDPVEHDVQDVCLGVAARSLETIAKHYGWLNEKLQVEGAGLGPTVILRDLTGAKVAPTDETGRDEDIDGTEDWDS